MTKVEPGVYFVAITEKTERPLPDLNKVINAVRMCGNDKHTYCPYRRTDRDDISICHEDLMSDVMDWLETLVPRVLTLDEYKATTERPLEDRAPVWLEWRGASGRWTIPNRAFELYGESWRCWTSRPTEKQREAEPWA